MTLTPSRPVPVASDPRQQMLEVELLLGERLLTAAELSEAGPIRWSWNPSLSQAQCEEFTCLPVKQHNGSLVVAISNNLDREERNRLQDVAHSQGLTLELRLAMKTDIEAILEETHSSNAANESFAADSDDAATSNEPFSLLANVNLAASLEEAPQEDITSNMDLESTNSSPIIKLVDKILIQALSSGTSDIHIEPQEDGLVIRLRHDGVLEQLGVLPKNIIPAITSRLKIMADLDIAERRLPQDGRIRRMFRGRVFDLRVSTLPTRFGEKVCLRLLDSGSTKLGLDKLISNQDALAMVRDMGSKPYGMILVTGPTGSGKSTTLYSLLSERNSPTINISTVEDPIEYSLKGISQTQVNREKGYDFARALRAFMRQDPDVLLVGETRDLETAKTAVEAALTGHLVLTTLHANDAPSAIARLAEMGVEPFLVSASLVGIVSQRLVRRVCPTCRVAYRPSEQELGRFGLLANSETNITFYKAKRSIESNEKPCATCKGLGYKGRIGVYEVLRLNDALATAISLEASTEQIRRLALENGMTTLLGYGLDLVRNGYTTLEEIGRMILTDAGLESERKAKALHTISCKGCGAGMQDEWLECPYCLTQRD
ncbi:MAG: GspE/PulE family protein [Cyanobacteria bacterium]|nr:GspE/PulE family protein [Cyanobacteriota bacterium]